MIELIFSHLNEIANVIIAITSLVGVVLGFINRHKIEVVHKATNSLTDRLVVSETEKAMAAGLKEGREDLNPPINRAQRD